MLTCFDVVARVKHADVRTRAYPPSGRRLNSGQIMTWRRQIRLIWMLVSPRWLERPVIPWHHEMTLGVSLYRHDHCHAAHGVRALRGRV
jgi:hypothetical protein